MHIYIERERYPLTPTRSVRLSSQGACESSSQATCCPQLGSADDTCCGTCPCLVPPNDPQLPFTSATYPVTDASVLNQWEAVCPSFSPLRILKQAVINSNNGMTFLPAGKAWWACEAQVTLHTTTTHNTLPRTVNGVLKATRSEL